MARTKLLSAAAGVTFGYGQVEPNHLSAQRTSQIYAQLPANEKIEKLENGQFVKYDYANHEVNFTGKGEWMLVYNEVKVYRDYEGDADFAMLKSNYNGRVYSPINGSKFSEIEGVDWTNEIAEANPYVIDSTDTPSKNLKYESPYIFETGDEGNKKLRLLMVPRVFKTNIGDIYTTNMVNNTIDTLAVGDILTVGANGILAKDDEPTATEMQWQVVKVYNLGDRQPAVKLMRIV